QAFHHFSVVRLREELRDAHRHDRTDVRRPLQRVLVGRYQGLQVAEMQRQVARGGFSHVAYAERVDEARERRALAAPDGLDQVGCRFFRHTFQPGESLRIQAVEVGRRLYDALVHE